MPLKIARESIVVRRNGVKMTAPIGKPFNFTDDEITQIEAASPNALLPMDVTELKANLAVVEEAEAAAAGGDKPAPRKKRAAAATDDDGPL
jgi:hypothetical protein